MKISSYTNVNYKMLFLILTLIALLITPQLAWAIDSSKNLFEISDTDISIKILMSLFGGLIDSKSTMAQDPMIGAIKFFNSGVLIIGGVLAAYTVLTATLSTAHEGEVLGKKYSSLWIPIRYSLGTAFLLPIIGGGYCFMQALVMWLVVQGIGLANGVWLSYVSHDLVQQKSVSTKPLTQASMISVAEKNFESAMCTLAYSQLQEDSTFSGISSYFGLGYQYERYKKTDWSGNVIGYGYGNVKAFINKSRCGVIEYPVQIKESKLTTNQPTNNTSLPDIPATPSNPDIKTYTGHFGQLSDLFKPIDVTFINNAHIKATDKLSESIYQIAIDAMKSKDTLDDKLSKEIYVKIEKAGLDYISTIQKTIDSQKDSIMNGLINKANEHGWIMAGAWFTTVIKTNELLFMTANKVPSITENTTAFRSGTINRDLKPYFAPVALILEHSKTGAKSHLMEEASEDGAANIGSGFANLINNVLIGNVTKLFTTVNIYELKSDTRHPLIILNDLGNRLETVIITALILTAIGFTPILLVPSPSLTSFLKAVLTVTGWFLSGPIVVFVTGTIALKYFLPNLPYIIWVGAIVGWILLVIEAVLAAPIWCIMHLHPNGDDLTGKGGNGYSLILSILLRPVLMVFGFIAALIISSVIGEFINKTFFEVFMSSSGHVSDYSSNGAGGFGNLFSMIAGTVLYLIVMYIFIRKCFGLIYELPNQLLRWVGGQDNTLGAFASEFGSANDRGQQMAAAGIGYASQNIGKGVQTLQSKMNKGQLEYEQNASTEAGATDDKDEMKYDNNGQRSGFFETAGKKFANESMKKHGLGSVGADGRVRNAVGENAALRSKSQQRGDMMEKTLGAESKANMDSLSGRSSKPLSGFSQYNMSSSDIEQESAIQAKEEAISDAAQNIYRAAGEGQEGKNAVQSFFDNLSNSPSAQEGGSTEDFIKDVNSNSNATQKNAIRNRMTASGFGSNTIDSVIKGSKQSSSSGSSNIDGKKADIYIDRLNGLKGNISAGIQQNMAQSNSSNINSQATNVMAAAKIENLVSNSINENTTPESIISIIEDNQEKLSKPDNNDNKMI